MPENAFQSAGNTTETGNTTDEQGNTTDNYRYNKQKSQLLSSEILVTRHFIVTQSPPAHLSRQRRAHIKKVKRGFKSVVLPKNQWCYHFSFFCKMLRIKRLTFLAFEADTNENVCEGRVLMML